MDKANVLKGNFSTKRTLHFTDAKIKKISTRSQKLDNWKEETVWSNKHVGFGIRISPIGNQSGHQLPAKFRLRYITTGTPKGMARNIKIIGADPTTITFSKALSWYKDQSAMLQQGINPNQSNRESRTKTDELSILELGEAELNPVIDNKKLAEATKIHYRSHLNQIIKRIGDRTFNDLTERDLKALLKDRNADHLRNFVAFLQRLENKLPPRFKPEETFTTRCEREFGKLPKRKSRKRQTLAYEPHQQQIAQFFLALQYAYNGYTVREGSKARWERVDTLAMTDIKNLSAKELDRLDITETYGQETSAIKDCFIKPTITHRATVDALMLMFLTGLRKKNVFEMKWEDVLWEDNTLLIPDMKMKDDDEVVKIPLTVYTKAILQYTKSDSQADDVYVFVNKNSRKQLSIGNYTEAYRRIAVWACMLDYTDEYPNIRSLTLDRDDDRDKPKTYKKNPLDPAIKATDLDVYLSLDKFFPELIRSLIEQTYDSMKQAADLNLNIRNIVKGLGFNPHGLRRTASNIASLLLLNPNIFLRHEAKTTGQKHYTAETTWDLEQKSLTRCHEYIDNRIFESLGNDTEHNEKVFASPILKFYELPRFIPQDIYFDMSKHKENQIGNEENILSEQYQLEDYPTEFTTAVGSPEDGSANDSEYEGDF